MGDERRPRWKRRKGICSSLCSFFFHVAAWCRPRKWRISTLCWSPRCPWLFWLQSRAIITFVNTETNFSAFWDCDVFLFSMTCFQVMGIKRVKYMFFQNIKDCCVFSNLNIWKVSEKAKLSTSCRNWLNVSKIMIIKMSIIKFHALGRSQRICFATS